MATTGYTDSQKAHAQVLLARSHAWTRAVRKKDGLAFVIFASSRRDDSDRPIGYYTTESACTCRGFWYRGQCSHQLAVKTEAERAHAVVGPRRASYDALFTDDVLGLTSAF